MNQLRALHKSTLILLTNSTSRPLSPHHHHAPIHLPCHPPSHASLQCVVLLFQRPPRLPRLIQRREKRVPKRLLQPRERAHEHAALGALAFAFFELCVELRGDDVPVEAAALVEVEVYLFGPVDDEVDEVGGFAWGEDRVLGAVVWDRVGAAVMG